MFKKFIPTFNVNSIYEIDLDALQQQGIKGIITDLDNTLVGAKEPLATPALVNWLKLVESSGFKVVIVSNNYKSRVAAFSEPLNLPYIYSARKPTSSSFRRALAILQLAPEETLMIGDQLLTDVLGGNRMGLQTMLVKPVAMQQEGIATRFNRRIERFIVARLKKKGLGHWRELEK